MIEQVECCFPELCITPAKASHSTLPDGHKGGCHLVAHPHLHPQSLPRGEDAPPARELANLRKANQIFYTKFLLYAKDKLKLFY